MSPGTGPDRSSLSHASTGHPCGPGAAGVFSPERTRSGPPRCRSVPASQTHRPSDRSVHLHDPVRVGSRHEMQAVHVLGTRVSRPPRRSNSTRAGDRLGFYTSQSPPAMTRQLAFRTSGSAMYRAMLDPRSASGFRVQPLRSTKVGDSAIGRDSRTCQNGQWPAAEISAAAASTRAWSSVCSSSCVSVCSSDPPTIVRSSQVRPDLDARGPQRRGTAERGGPG
ncbi:MAG: hypothetical protein CM1200mP26_13930 [Acidimicrobiales bacterium]|nr:MAG: hypothetical protein CM1200mP26_13930 [Acidimicrobiales bacterium]